MAYANPGGFNFGATNLDGYGISLLAFIVVYTILLSVSCFMDFSVYTMNGRWPCNVEFWSMSLYLPIGIGLWQAQNQQLIIVSREQTEMSRSHHPVFKPLLPPRGRGMGTPSYWFWRLKIWYRSISSQGKYEGFVLFGIIIQFSVSMVIYNISRKFSSYGLVGHPTTHSPRFKTYGNESSEHIIQATPYEELSEYHISNNGMVEYDPLGNVEVPTEFSSDVFDAAYQSVRYMVWSETWQRYCAWRLKAGGDSGEAVGQAL